MTSTPSRPRWKAACPSATLLSHDLFEGIFARAGLASDVEVVEDFPARYDVAALRHHRWARGDWQLLPWILGPGATAAPGIGRAAVPAIGRWKMLDNLRRSLSAPAAGAGPDRRLGPAARGRRDLDAFILSTIVLPPLIPVIARHRAASPWRDAAQPFPGLGARSSASRLSSPA